MGPLVLPSIFRVKLNHNTPIYAANFHANARFRPPVFQSAASYQTQTFPWQQANNNKISEVFAVRNAKLVSTATKTSIGITHINNNPKTRIGNAQHGKIHYPCLE